MQACRWGDLIDGLGTSVSADFDAQSFANITTEQLQADIGNGMQSASCLLGPGVDISKSQVLVEESPNPKP